jgi:hypothetical protein
MLTPDMREKLDIYRRKVTEGTVTRDELAEAVRIMREGRLGAASASKASKAKKEASVVDSDSLLDDFLK